MLTLGDLLSNNFSRDVGIFKLVVMRKMHILFININFGFFYVMHRSLKLHLRYVNTSFVFNNYFSR